MRLPQIRRRRSERDAIGRYWTQRRAGAVRPDSCPSIGRSPGRGPELFADARVDLDFGTQAGLAAIALALREQLDRHSPIRPPRPACRQLALSITLAPLGRLRRIQQTAFTHPRRCSRPPEVPASVLFRRTYLGVAFAALVLRAARHRQDDRRVHHRAGFHQQTMQGEPLVDLGKNALREWATLQQSPEIEHRRPVRHTLVKRITSAKSFARQPITLLLFVR